MKCRTVLWSFPILVPTTWSHANRHKCTAPENPSTTSRELVWIVFGDPRKSWYLRIWGRASANIVLKTPAVDSVATRKRKLHFKCVCDCTCSESTRQTSCLFPHVTTSVQGSSMPLRARTGTRSSRGEGAGEGSVGKETNKRHSLFKPDKILKNLHLQLQRISQGSTRIALFVNSSYRLRLTTRQFYSIFCKDPINTSIIEVS